MLGLHREPLYFLFSSSTGETSHPGQQVATHHAQALDVFSTRVRPNERIGFVLPTKVHGETVRVKGLKFSPMRPSGWISNLGAQPPGAWELPKWSQAVRHMFARPNLRGSWASQIMGEQDTSGKAGTRTVNTSERLTALRLLLKENQVDAYVV
ncbi:hypothetical protein RSAG8_05913, partial [Rhizoctonia solani AG-8 WAC10335]